MGYNVSRRSQQVQHQTHEGGRAFHPSDPLEELYLLSVNTLMMGGTFYETGEERHNRFLECINKASQSERGQTFVSKLAMYARERLHLRTVPTMLVAHALTDKFPLAQDAARRAWVRGDEHLEAFAYLDAIGVPRTKSFLRAVADRFLHMSEKQAIKYASSGKAYTQKDALRLSHPKAGEDEKQGKLLKYIRYGWSELTEAERSLLPLIAKTKGGEALTWEQKLSAEGKKDEEEQDKGRAWKEIIPDMGYMALLRNLRNIAQANVDADTIMIVADRIADKDRVLRSKQLPFRFLNAARALTQAANVPNEFMGALGKAMDHAAENIPEVSGKTVVLVDVSGSMTWGLNESCGAARSQANRIDVAALLAASFVKKNVADVVVFSSQSAFLFIPPNTPVGAASQLITQWKYAHGGTNLGAALQTAISKHANASVYDRMVVLTDEQAHDDVWDVVEPWLREDRDRKIYVVNLAGYEPRAFLPSHGQIFTAGGFNETVFDWIRALELKSPVDVILNYE
jgi:hypothetical protein